MIEIRMYKINEGKTMKRSLIKVLSILVLQLMVNGDVFAQAFNSEPTIDLPEIVEPSESFTISWPAGEFIASDRRERVFERGYQLYRVVSGSTWELIYETPGFAEGEFTDSLSEEGTYQYRLTRVVGIFEEEEYGYDCEVNTNCRVDDYRVYQSKVEFPLSIEVATFEPNQVMCGITTPPNCINIDTPQNLTVNRISSDHSVDISWDSVVEFQRYELEEFDYTYNQWVIIYDGDQQTLSDVSLESGLNQFRVRACIDQLCGQSSFAEQIDVEPFNITAHQCEPVL